jgi:hypothetical protein
LAENAPVQVSRMNRTASDAIRVARVLCIVCMSYVHLQLYPATDLPIVEAVVVDTLGRSSVPLLSVISGVLMVPFFERRRWPTAIWSRFRSLIVPMAIWNVFAVVIWGYEFLPNDILAVTAAPKLLYLAFLRDLFVVSSMTPILVWCARRAPYALIVATCVFYLADPSTVLILRPQIAFFYVAGVLLAVFPLRFPAWLKVGVLVAFGALVALEILGLRANDHLFDNLLRRPVTAAAFWVMSLWLAERWPSLAKFDVAVFPYFLAHGLIFEVVGACFLRLPFLHGSATYLLTWLLAPPLCFAAFVVLWPYTGRVGKALAA